MYRFPYARGKETRPSIVEKRRPPDAQDKTLLKGEKRGNILAHGGGRRGGGVGSPKLSYLSKEKKTTLIESKK